MQLRFKHLKKIFAVFSGTILFYLGKKYLNREDAEDNFAMVESEDISG